MNTRFKVTPYDYQDGPWVLYPGVQPATSEQAALVSLALQHDQGIRVDVLLSPEAAEDVARHIVEAARAVRTGKTPTFSPQRSA